MHMNEISTSLLKFNRNGEALIEYKCQHNTYDHQLLLTSLMQSKQLIIDLQYAEQS